MKRKPITKASGRMSNEETTDNMIKIFLSRMCTHEEAVDYLLSAVPPATRDDMLGELAVQYAKRRRKR